MQYYNIFALNISCLRQQQPNESDSIKRYSDQSSPPRTGSPDRIPFLIGSQTYIPAKILPGLSGEPLTTDSNNF